MDQDTTECHRQSVSHQGWAIFQANRLDRDAFNRCMERKGYSVRVEK
jgi:hypothetical protein